MEVKYDLTDKEQSRTYFWVTSPPAPAFQINNPTSLIIGMDGSHVVEGNDNCIYTMRGFDICKVELKGGVVVDNEAEIIDSL